MMGSGSDPRPTRFVSFSGIDGAGKSTQIEALQHQLEFAGLRVRVLTFWDDVACFTSLRETAGHTLFKGDKGVGSPERPIERRDKNVRSRMMTFIRWGMYFADAISLRFAVRRAFRSGVDFVICDRYAWDELANLDLRNWLTRRYVRLLAWMVPRPDVSYLLDADPVLARARKPEYPLDFLYECRESYLALSEVVGGITVIPPGPIGEVADHIRSCISLDVEPEQRGASRAAHGDAVA
ncbi:MAG: dTMP kinase [Acidobacteriota bacterium]